MRCPSFGILFKIVHSSLFSLYFVISTVSSMHMFNIKYLPMTGFDPWTSGVETTHSAN